MKHSKISVKWKIAIYLCAFTILLLSIVWIFQVFFLDDFYKSTRIKEMNTIINTVENNIDSVNIYDKVSELSRKYDACIQIRDIDNNVLYSKETAPYCSIFRENSVLNYILSSTDENNGEYTFYLDKKTFFQNDSGKKINVFDTVLRYHLHADSQSVIKSKHIYDFTGEYYILVHIEITPLAATTQTIMQQLYGISAVFILLAVIISMLLAKLISEPIVRINKTAKRLAAGEYGVNFDGNGYREISELNDTMNYASRELSKVEGYRRELISNVSHDLRTPLTMIVGYSEVMRDIPDENTPENVQVIIDEAKRLSALVDDILSISKIQSGTDTLSKITYDITASTKQIIDRYSKMKDFEGYKIIFDYSENITVCADEMKIMQVIYNLINNALNYTGDDKKVVIKQTRVKKADGYCVRFDVIDTGEGIAKENLIYVFDRYYKENKAHKRASVGTGLGLSIVKGIISMHNGEYGVQSEENKGSDFWFSIQCL